MKPRRVACILFVLVTVSANAADVPITKGMPFLGARKALIKHGWKPYITNETELVGAEVLLNKMGILEIESCTEGVQYCEFHYKKKKECLSVTTTGEEVRDLIIYGWNFKCHETN
jgi:hypothetical protein